MITPEWVGSQAEAGLPRFPAGARHHSSQQQQGCRWPARLSRQLGVRLYDLDRTWDLMANTTNQCRWQNEVSRYLQQLADPLYLAAQGGACSVSARSPEKTGDGSALLYPISRRRRRVQGEGADRQQRTSRSISTRAASLNGIHQVAGADHPISRLSSCDSYGNMPVRAYRKIEVSDQGRKAAGPSPI